MKWYRLAAKQGYAPAQWALGKMYVDGKGVPQNYKTAVKWYKLAAEQGLAIAQYNLGRMYREGNGVPQDYVRAHMWENIAATNGSKLGAGSTAYFELYMTSSQLETAQNLTRECVRKKYKGC